MMTSDIDLYNEALDDVDCLTTRNLALDQQLAEAEARTGHAEQRVADLEHALDRALDRIRELER